MLMRRPRRPHLDLDQTELVGRLWTEPEFTAQARRAALADRRCWPRREVLPLGATVGNELPLLGSSKAGLMHDLAPASDLRDDKVLQPSD